MTKILTDLSSPALVRAIQQNMLDLIWELRPAWKQARFYENGKLRRWASPLPIAFLFNAAVSLQPPGRDETALIDETIAFFQSRGKGEFDWWLSPGLEASGWGRQLEGHGLHFEADTPGMAVNLADLPERISTPEGLKIEIVQDKGMMSTWGKTFVQGYMLPAAWEKALMGMMEATMSTPLVSYLATVEGQAVGASMMYLDAGAAGIYNVATLPDWRGKGIGAAMTLQPLLDARRMGYRAGVLQASEMGYGVYRRLGFEELCRLGHYHWQANPKAE